MRTSLVTPAILPRILGCSPRAALAQATLLEEQTVDSSILLM